MVIRYGVHRMKGQITAFITSRTKDTDYRQKRNQKNKDNWMNCLFWVYVTIDK